jgi:hypothetical protein
VAPFVAWGQSNAITKNVMAAGDAEASKMLSPLFNCSRNNQFLSNK